MNAWLYFTWREITDPSVPSSARNEMETMKVQMMEWGIPAAKGKQVLDEYSRILEDPQADPKEEGQKLLDGLNGKKMPLWQRMMDVLLVLPLYLGLYQALFLCWIAPVFDQTPVQNEMSFSLGVVLQGILIYVIFKGLMWIVTRNPKGMKRWAAFAGCFFLYLAGMYVTNHMEGGLMLPVWLVLVCMTVLFCFGWWWHRRRFDLTDQSTEKEERINYELNNDL